jgi:hypothetical protein
MSKQTMPSEQRHELELLLERYIALHERILDLTNLHRAALSKADGEAMKACLAQQQGLWTQVRDLDAARAKLAQRLAARASDASTQPTIAQLAQHLPEPSRHRVLALSAALRDLLSRIQKQSQVIQSATRTLLAHMDGLMQQVVRTVNRARVYTTRGTIAPDGPVVCGVDLVR